MADVQQQWWLTGLVGMVLGGILVSVLRPVLERLGNALAEGLSRLGSGWGFRTRYLSHLVEEHRRLNIRGRGTTAPVTVELEQAYVSLHAQMLDSIQGHEESPALDIGQAMAQHRRLAILGGPGTGKTTLLAYLALTYARRKASERLGLREERLPILIPLRRLRQVLDGDGAGTLPAYLTEWYAELGMHPGGGFFEKALRTGRCLVLLDGLDEVADETERRRMSEWVDRLVTIYPRNRYIVTSRPPGYEAAPLLSGFTVLRIREFSAEDIRQFTASWCLAVEFKAQGEENVTARGQALNAAQDLVAAIEANVDIRRLAVNPLLLSIIVLVHRYQARLPRRRVDLYSECVDTLLGRWDEAKGLIGRLSPSEKRGVLQSLALEMHQAGRSHIPQGELEEHIGSLLPKVGGWPTDTADFVDEVRERSGLLAGEEPGGYAFSHLTFQEYLVAREMADNEKKRKLLLENIGDDWWQEVTLLYAGMAEATPIVEALLAVEDDPSCTRLLLAGRCVAEAPQMKQHARERVIDRLEERLATSTDGLFLRTGQVLAEIAGEDSVDFFLRLAHDDPEERETTLWSLGQMVRQPNNAVGARVMEQLLARFEGEELQEEAGAALVEVWFGGSTTELEKCLPSSVLAHARGVLAEAMDYTMVTVPAGEFQMGEEKQRVHVDTFQIGKYAVTNAQYKRFVDATGHPPPPYWEGRDCPAGKAIHPVVFVSWYDAEAYVKWAGKRLPTEEEWEKAARGTDGREYPWGDWEEGRCNTREAGIGDTTPVDQYSPLSDSPYGCVDMAGNVWEWTAPGWVSTNPVVRGGSHNYLQGIARCSYRIRHNPHSPSNDLGLRVAASRGSP
jgi:hypothetical protein